MNVVQVASNFISSAIIPRLPLRSDWTKVTRRPEITQTRDKLRPSNTPHFQRSKTYLNLVSATQGLLLLNSTLFQPLSIPLLPSKYMNSSCYVATQTLFASESSTLVRPEHRRRRFRLPSLDLKRGSGLNVPESRCEDLGSYYVKVY